MAIQTDFAPETDSLQEKGLTVRSVGIALGAVVFINLWVTYAETVVHASSRGIIQGDSESWSSDSVSGAGSIDSAHWTTAWASLTAS